MQRKYRTVPYHRYRTKCQKYHPTVPGTSTGIFERRYGRKKHVTVNFHTYKFTVYKHYDGNSIPVSIPLKKMGSFSTVKL